MPTNTTTAPRRSTAPTTASAPERPTATSEARPTDGSSPARADARRQAEIRRRELASFLRNRRERISPEQVGLPTSGRRRTPGLRREEVAQLAGVGVTWYTWLEQGRDIKASTQVLDAISATLQLDPYERSHLLTLAGTQTPVVEKECRAISPQLHLMLRQLEPFPACVVNARFDILAYNRLFDWMFDGVLAELPYEERNSMLLSFTNDKWRARLVDREVNAPLVVGQFRAAMAEHVAEPAWKSLVKRLRQESAEFDALWRNHDVTAPLNLTKRFRHPDAGLLTFDYTYLWTGTGSRLRVTTYTPADEETWTKVRAWQTHLEDEQG